MIESTGNPSPLSAPEAFCNLTKLHLIPPPSDPDALHEAVTLPAGYTLAASEIRPPDQQLQLLDSFDRLLLGQKKVLLRQESNFALALLKTSQILVTGVSKLKSQDIDPSDLPDELASFVKPVVYPRVVFWQNTLLWRQWPWVLRDDEEKIIAHVNVHHWQLLDQEAPLQDQWGLEVCTLRGYDSEVSQLNIPACFNPDPQNLPLQPLTDLIGPWLKELTNNGYRSKPSLQFRHDEPAIEIFAKAMQENLNVVLANLDGVSRDRDPEFLHDYRVALRRMRAILSLLKGVYAPELKSSLGQSLKEFAKATNAQRDLDVWLLDADEFCSLLPDSMHLGFKRLQTQIAHERKRAYQGVKQYLKKHQVESQLESLLKQFTDDVEAISGPSAQTPAATIASRKLRKQSNQLIKAADSITFDSPDDDVHEVRIHIKKLRYVLDLFKPIANVDMARTLTRNLKALQDHLGKFNDLAVQQEFLSEIMTSLEQQNKLELSSTMTAGALLCLMQQESRQAKSHIIGLLPAFAESLKQMDISALFDPNTGIEPERQDNRQ